jgi:hypothetical protein
MDAILVTGAVGIVGIAGSVGSAIFAQRYARGTTKLQVDAAVEADRVKDARSLRDRRIERLRGEYLVIVADFMRSGFENRPDLAALDEQLSRVRALLVLEEETFVEGSVPQRVQRRIIEAQAVVTGALIFGPTPSTGQELTAAFTFLTGAMSKHLTDLEQPI